MSSKLYLPNDVKPMNTQTPTKSIVARLGPRKRKETPSCSINSTPVITPTVSPTVIFAGTAYNLKLNRHSMVAFDFDGTIATQMRPYDPRRAGPPLNPDDPQSAFNLCKKLVRTKKVIILTARMNTTEHTPAQLSYTRKLIGGWTKKYLGVRLPCTAEKHHLMSVMYDDRGVSVNPKTGKIVNACNKNKIQYK